ncbi:peptide deformylase [Alkaliphilus metalliredigens QYMF]|uniref:Peptide deformylase n=1 Tax=Alkaliphilus metalliredigens (strain QYMF) TaxID=293826 RepID=DEF_ALKMQ|nr:peptide deformylase [Alkaliphilus metalliredigens]A6TRW8.1 RecName: Full=Peptide deformylase; Short=PDF; AltName: Full=Polypeptide deformylase [Alkaliphilus metalliredigens QYMF]ABR48936.1 peptide deformylase [Alkaliphilus metalliredigens QYMF]
MAIRLIRTDDDPVLRKKSRVVDKIDSRIHTLLDDMIETMYEADGVGLAAPQVGILKQVIVIDVGEGVIELINPEIIKETGSQCDVEGCLSLPGHSGEVERPAIVKVRGLNRQGKMVEIQGTELLARALCHEIDHLNGILFTDKIIKE